MNTKHIQLPRGIFDFVLQVILKTPLTSEQLKLYTEKYQKWLKDECPQDWFQQKSHFLKLCRDEQGRGLQTLVYYGSGVKSSVTVVDSHYINGREYKLKYHESLETMKSRIYFFARIMDLPIQTVFVTKLSGLKDLEPKIEQIRQLYTPMYDTASKSYTLHYNTIKRQSQGGVIIHSPTHASFVLAPQIQFRFESIPIFCEEMGIRGFLQRKGYKLLKLVSCE